MNAVPFRRFLVCFVALAMIAQTATAQTVVPQRDQEADETARPRAGGIKRADVLERKDKTVEGSEEGMPRFREGVREQSLWPHFPTPNRERWRFGVFAYNTNTGIVVTRVVPGSAASRLQMEPGDRIVTVNGFQIGWIQDRLYPFAAELQLQADRRGRVTLLLQNVRNNQLLARDVQLDRIGSFGGPRRR